MNELVLEKHDYGNIFRQLRESISSEDSPCTLRRLSELMKERLGETIQHTHIHELEVGKREPSLKELTLYHKFFNVSFEELIGSEDDIHIVSFCRTLSRLKDDDEQGLMDILVELVSTERGLALLYYIALYLNSSASGQDALDLFCKRMKVCKDSKFPSACDYQMIRATIDNEVSNIV